MGLNVSKWDNELTWWKARQKNDDDVESHQTSKQVKWDSVR